MVFLNGNGISPSIGAIPMMNQFDMAYLLGGPYWMIFYWPTVFLNFILIIKLIEYGLLNNWSNDTITLGTISLIFIIPMAISMTVWYLHKILGVI